MVMLIIQEGETKNFWRFKELGHNTRAYDIEKNQLKNSFLQLEQWQKEPGASNFSSKLFELIAKADAQNFRKLFNGFPARVTAYCLWFHSREKEDLQKYYGGSDGNNQF